MSNSTENIPPIVPTIDGVKIPFQREGNVTDWGTLETQVREVVQNSLGDEFSGTISIRKAVPRVQERVGALLIFAQPNGANSNDAHVVLVEE